MNIIYQDNDIIVIDKPAGLSVLPDGWEAGADYVVKLLEPEFGRIWVVHRIDKVTSGVMIFARNAESHRTLNMQFEKHEEIKKYRAIVNGNPKWNEHTAKHPLRINVGHKHRTMVDAAHGKPSETQFTVIKRYQDYALIIATPRTGRTHQIRVHAYALGYPLLSDTLYGAPPTDLIARPALHAISLTLTHPVTNEQMSFEAPYPEDFEKALKSLNSE